MQRLQTRRHLSGGSVDAPIRVFLNHRSFLQGGLISLYFLRRKQGVGLALEHSQHGHGPGRRLPPSLNPVFVSDDPYAYEAVRFRQEARGSEVFTVDPQGGQDVGAAKLQREGVWPTKPGGQLRGV